MKVKGVKVEIGTMVLMTANTNPDKQHIGYIENINSTSFRVKWISEGSSPYHNIYGTELLHEPNYAYTFTVL